MDILGSVRAVCKILTEGELFKNGVDDSLRIMDIIDQSGADVLNRLRQDSRYRAALDTTVSVQELATNSSKVAKDSQTCWTCCLGELAKLFLEFASEPVRIAWEMVSRPKDPLPFDPSPPDLLEDHQHTAGGEHEHQDLAHQGAGDEPALVEELHRFRRCHGRGK